MRTPRSSAKKPKRPLRPRQRPTPRAKANHKSRTQRVEEHKAENARRRAAEEDETSSEEEDPAEARRRLLREQKEADLKHAEDLFGDLDVGRKRAAGPRPVTIAADGGNPADAIDLSAQAVFRPKNKAEFNKLRDVLVPLVGGNARNAAYPMFLQELVKELYKDLASEQVKKAASALTTLANEKLKEEKAADKGGEEDQDEGQGDAECGKECVDEGGHGAV